MKKVELIGKLGLFVLVFMISFYGFSNDLFRNNAIFSCKINGKERFLVIPRELAEFANKIDDRMKEKEESMKLQYKMEGF